MEKAKAILTGVDQVAQVQSLNEATVTPIDEAGPQHISANIAGMLTMRHYRHRVCGRPSFDRFTYNSDEHQA